ncbi:MAG TPA: CheR family methyltransferase, partial [Candidatus Deferrimicrobium sp.]|nr:CheR family methyltransferase [Candidatus Deferrimicrobium sp.]
WSAACSTGEEAYSIAIVLDKKKEELKDFNILILATDINRKALKTASEGTYGEWSFRGSPPLLKDAYFTREEKKQYKIRDDLRDKVVFEYLNLVLEVRPPFLNNTNGMDIIFCRNVLMYFEPQMAKKVAAYLFRCLAPGGWLIASPTDALNISVPGLLRVDIPEAPVYRKIPGEGTMPRYNAGAEATTTSGPGFDLPPPPSPASRVETAEKNIPATVMSHYKEALELYRQGFYIKAAEILESLLSRPPKPMPENTDAAEVMETRAFELLARTHANQGKLDTAAKWCLKAIASAKLCLQCRYLLAVIQLEQGKTEEATASLKQSLYIDPNFIPAHFTLGHIAQQKKNFNEANRYFDNCLFLLNDLDPGAKVIELDKWLTAGHLKEMILILKEKVSPNE